MIEKMLWLITGAGRRLGVDIAKDEPSHIHLPRRRRVGRPGDQGTSATWSDEEYGAAPPALSDLQPAGLRR